ncbi:MAG TPA: hypothetical protein VGZ01_05445, partial [Trinickia sp.]|jgi:hypothetical protein|nr:hypothetical protein [Trinickia sp.]
MKIRSLTMLAALSAAALSQVGCTAVPPDYAYSTTVQLAGGKTLDCAVNEPLAGTRAPLSRSEQTRADVLATQRLRVVSGPSSDYPTPYTAPDVQCGATD